MKMTKAQRIFQDTYTACRIHIKDWGFEKNPDGKAVGFWSLDTEEPVYARTLNEIDKLIDSNMKMVEFDRKYGFEDDWTDLCDEALQMVRSTVENVRARL